MSDDGLSDAWLHHITSWVFQLKKPKHLAVAVSGGGDSMACLEIMRWHAADAGFELSAVTVDHGLREEARDEIALVTRHCAEHQINHSVLNWDWDGKGNLQASARTARYQLMAEWANAQGVDCIALGHTQDDVAETFLMRLARKAGVDGLSHMQDRFERDGVTFVRPIMSHTREDWRLYLRRNNVEWAEDASNEDERFDRVKVRKIIPELSKAGIGIEALSTVAHNMQSARWALNHYAWRETVENQIAVESNGDVVVHAQMSPANNVPEEVIRRLHVASICWVSGQKYAPSSEAMIEMSAAFSHTNRHSLSGCIVTREIGEKRSDAKLRICREYNAVKNISVSSKALWDGRWKLTGPHAKNLEIRALGEAVKDTPWRETGVPRESLLASPAIWDGEELIAAPVAGYTNGWTAEATGRGNFADFLLSR